MTATNHVLTGAVIAAATDKPLIALPLALLSHFVLDAVPHFGWKNRDFKFLLILATDMAIAASVLLALMILQPANWLLMVICGIIAASPDLLWLYYLIFELQKKPKEKNLFARFASRIQWSETNWGLLMEIAWTALAAVVLVNLTVS